MTRAECENLGILLASLGEPPSSIGYAMVRRTDELRDLVAPRADTPFLSEYAPIDPEKYDALDVAAARIEAGADLLTVFGDLCRPAPMEKL